MRQGSYLKALGEKPVTKSLSLLEKFISLLDVSHGCLSVLQGHPYSFSHGPFRCQTSTGMWSPSHAWNHSDFSVVTRQRKLSASKGFT